MGVTVGVTVVSMGGGVGWGAIQGPAATGQLVFLCGGDRDLFDKASKDLDLMGKVRSTPLNNTRARSVGGWY